MASPRKEGLFGQQGVIVPQTDPVQTGCRIPNTVQPKYDAADRQRVIAKREPPGRGPDSNLAIVSSDDLEPYLYRSVATGELSKHVHPRMTERIPRRQDRSNRVQDADESIPVGPRRVDDDLLAQQHAPHQRKQ